MHSDTTVYDGKTGTSVRYPMFHLVQPDGTVEVHWQSGQIDIYSDEAAARAATGWPGLIFTQANLDAQAAKDAWYTKCRYVRGQYENEPYEALAPYVTACEAGDPVAAQQAIHDLDAALGYRSGAAHPDAVIVRMVRAHAVHSTRSLLAGDYALAYPEPDGTYSVYSARSAGWFASVTSTKVRVVS